MFNQFIRLSFRCLIFDRQPQTVQQWTTITDVFIEVGWVPFRHTGPDLRAKASLELFTMMKPRDFYVSVWQFLFWNEIHGVAWFDVGFLYY